MEGPTAKQAKVDESVKTDLSSRDARSSEATEVASQPREQSMKTLTIAQVKALGAHKSVAAVEGKVCVVKASSKLVQVCGVDEEMRECVICDATDTIKLYLWERHVFAVNALGSYRFSRLATRDHAGGTCLMGCGDTSVLQIEDVRVPESVLGEALGEGRLEKIVGPVTGVLIEEELRCSTCLRAQTEISSKAPTLRCEQCKLLQKRSGFICSLSGTLVVTENGVDAALTVTDAVLRGYLVEEKLTHLVQNVQDIEEHFLNVDSFEVTYDGENYIASLKVCRAFVEGPSSPAMPSNPGGVSEPSAYGAYGEDVLGALDKV